MGHVFIHNHRKTFLLLHGVQKLLFIIARPLFKRSIDDIRKEVSETILLTPTALLPQSASDFSGKVAVNLSFEPIRYRAWVFGKCR